MSDLRLRDLPGVVESALSDAVLAQLPASTPAPPWHCRVRAVVWVQRGTAPLPGAPALPLTVGAVVDYLDSPVGPYREVFAGVLLRRPRPTVTVPFIAVDSVPSVHGGRAHWGLPKTLATFEGDVGAGRATASGDGWSVQVSADGRSVAVPMVAGFGSDQGQGRARVSVRGRGRLTRVHVRATGPTLAGWLGEGVHVGVVGVGRLVVGAPRTP